MYIHTLYYVLRTYVYTYVYIHTYVNLAASIGGCVDAAQVNGAVCGQNASTSLSPRRGVAGAWFTSVKAELLGSWRAGEQQHSDQEKQHSHHHQQHSDHDDMRRAQAFVFNQTQLTGLVSA